MGNKQTIFSEIQLELYQDVTFFRRNEILRVFDVRLALKQEYSYSMVIQTEYDRTLSGILLGPSEGFFFLKFLSGDF